MKSFNSFIENQEKEKDRIIPFGSPDASRASSVEDMEKVGSKGFVRIFNENSGISNYGTEHFRVIVGKKGSGKTLYLRRYYINLKKENSIYSENFDTVLEYLNQIRPQTEHILKFSQLFNGELLTEKWRILWRLAIIRTIITHITNNSKLSDIKKRLPKDFRKKYKKILSSATRPITIFSQVIEIIDEINDGKDFNRLTDSILWSELEFDLSLILKDSAPLYFFVDAIDEEYQHAPMYWLRAQKGLFYALMQFLRDASIGGKLHILISIRDHVYSSVLASEHETRYLDPSYVTILHWNPDTAKFLLIEKVKHLDDNIFIKKGAKNIENWLGLKEINNTKRNVTELVSDYLVRHSRSIPRDIIILGNSISAKILEIRNSNNNFEYFESELKEIVHFYAKRFAQEQIQISANHLTANLMPSEAFKLGIHKMYTSAYYGDQEYLNLSNIFIEKIKEIILFIGKDRFNKSELIKAKDYAIKIFDVGSDLNIFDVLWQNGLLGFDIDDNYSEFFTEISNDFKLPIHPTNFVFHSILIDLYDLEAVGKPVRIKSIVENENNKRS